MKPPNLTDLLKECDRSTNETLVSPDAEEWLKSILKLVEQGRRLGRNPADDPIISAQITQLAIDLNQLGNDSLELLQKTRNYRE